MAVDTLSDALLDAILGCALADQLKIASTLLSVSSRFRCSCLRLLFHSVTIPDDARHLPDAHGNIELPLTRGPLTAFLKEPDVYGAYVKIVKVADPVVLSSGKTAQPSPIFQMDDERDSDTESDHPGPVPIPSFILQRWLRSMPELEELRWTSGGLPPDGLCETVATYCKGLRTFSYIPSPSMVPVPLEKGTLASTRSGPLKWDATSLPHLSQLPYLSALYVSRLSHEGSSALSHLLRLIATGAVPLPSSTHEEPGLEHLGIDVLWLDEELCNAIADLGSSNRKLKTLWLGTQGTKLRDKQLDKILEGCEQLETLEFREVEGRISRTYWSTTTLPPNLQCLSLSLSETGPHHSWVADHFHSISSLSLNTLRSVHITRARSPLRLLDREPVSDDVGRGPGHHIPSELVRALKGGRLRELECDWWLWRVEDVKMLVDDCPFIESIKVAFDAPFTRIFSLISSLASLSMLHAISLSVPVQHAPLLPSPSAPQAYLPPSPTTPYTPLTPSTSPVKGGSYSALRMIEPPTPPVESSSLGGVLLNDPSLPAIRDIKKLAKRCDKLGVLQWYGQNARGSWVIEHEPALKVTYQEPPRPPACILERFLLEQEAIALGWKNGKRDGQPWVTSEWLREEREREKERELEKAREKERQDQRTKSKEKEKDAKVEEAEKAQTEIPKSPATNGFPPPLVTPSKPSAAGKRSPRRTVSDSADGPSRDGKARGPSSRGNGRGRGSGGPSARSVSAGDSGRKPAGGGSGGGSGRAGGGRQSGDRSRGSPRSARGGGTRTPRGRGGPATH